MHFLKYDEKVYAFKALDSYNLAKYIITHPQYVQVQSNYAVITCNKTFRTYTVAKHQFGGYIADGHISADNSMLFELVQSVRGV